MKSDGLMTRLAALVCKHKKLFKVILLVICLYALLYGVGLFYKPLSPEVLLKKENADRVKPYLLGFGLLAPALFIVLQTLQVILIAIPGQVTGFIGGLFGADHVGDLFFGAYVQNHHLA